MKENLADVKEELESGEALLVDVREREEWDAGHVKRARFVPLSSLQNGKFPDLDRSKKLYLYCRSGRRVHSANELLKAMDFRRVIPLAEGFRELAANGFEAEMK